MRHSLQSAILVFVLMLATSAAAAGGYTHPSGAFSMATFGTLEEETGNGALFVNGDATLMVLFGEVSVEITAETLPDIVQPILDGVQSFSQVDLYSDEMLALENGTLIPFEYTQTDDTFGAGDVFVAQDDDTLYVMILLAENYDTVVDDWVDTVESFVPGAEISPAATARVPAKTPAKVTPTPTRTPKSKPTATATPAAKKAAAGHDSLSGFDPDVDGFSFFNYGNEISATNLTAAEVHRMFGDQVCASLSAGGDCTLSPPAKQWMQQINGYMDGGHCEGMAVLSALMYYNQVEPDQFGDNIPFDLTLENNVPLQREIAYWWTTQATFPGADVRISESPGAVLDTLIETFSNGKNASEWWVMGFYQPDGSEGHAVTPIGVEELGGGLYNILVYDNNFPGETRAIEVDRNAETWQYESSPNPDIESFLYTGDADAQNLELVAISPRLETQECDFCAGGPVSAFDDGAGALNSTAAQKRTPTPTVTPEPSAFPIWEDVLARWGLLVIGEADDFYQVWLNGKADLLVIDSWGRRIGYSDGEFFDEIPGASTRNMRIFFQQEKTGLDKDKSPVFRIPVGLSFEVIVDGTPLEDAAGSDVTMIGPGYYLEVSDIWLEPGEMDSIGVGIDKSRYQLTYFTDYTESPVIAMGLETEEAGYALIVQATELTGAEDSFDIALDTATQEFIINTSFNTEPSTYEILVQRLDDAGETVFGASDVVFEPENTAYIPFALGNDTSLPVDVDYENDGEIDESFELPDVTGEISFEGDNLAE